MVGSLSRHLDADCDLADGVDCLRLGCMAIPVRDAEEIPTADDLLDVLPIGMIVNFLVG